MMNPTNSYFTLEYDNMHNNMDVSWTKKLIAMKCLRKSNLLPDSNQAFYSSSETANNVNQIIPPPPIFVKETNHPSTLSPTSFQITFTHATSNQTRDSNHPPPILPDSQFGFRSAHSTIHQVFWLVDTILCTLEKKYYCTCAFLDISQAFDKVWYEELIFKLKKILSHCLFLLIKSYLSDRHFQIQYGSSEFKIEKILAGPITQNTSVADYLDDKAIISILNPLTAQQISKIIST
ncbi:Uncharacterized protein FWK35_00034357 [Aphis craccivora]|uniref:Reverse transcriptase domain-containing protein n=1 Tax=Aphis craccivora TaxID=307492 RepID=A0A6G0Y962_APHCR|nr:Uncharacterized protein FWK35_00034357 [Aphis craccivora]